MNQPKTETPVKPAVVDEPLRAPAPLETRPVHVSDLAVASTSIIDDPRFDEEAMQQRFNRRQRLIRLCFQMTSPSQWVLFKDEKKGTASVYPMGGAADAIILHILGCVWRDEEIKITKRTEEGEPALVECSGLLVSMGADERPIARFTGYREPEGFLKSEPDLKKGARENMKSVAVRDLLGLRGRSPDELATLGLDLSKTGTATFQNSKDGDIVTFPPFGSKKGLRIDDPSVSDKDLEWYANKAKESLANPEKAKYHKSEQKRLDAYRAEFARRAEVKKKPADTKPPDPPAAGEDFPAGDFPEPGTGG